MDKRHLLWIIPLIYSYGWAVGRISGYKEAVRDVMQYGTDDEEITYEQRQDRRWFE